MQVLDYTTHDFMLVNGEIQFESKPVGLTEQAFNELVAACRALDTDPEMMFTLRINVGPGADTEAYVEAYSSRRRIDLTPNAAYDLRMERL